MMMFMTTKNTFFANSEDSSLEEIRKIIDAEVAYNRLLEKKLHQGKDEEVFEIFASMFIELSEIPPLIKLPSASVLRDLKQKLLDQIATDLENYERLNACTESKDVTPDKLYLAINLVYQNSLIDLTSITRKKLEGILSFLYAGKELSKKVKEVFSRINTKNLKSPYMAELHSVAEMLNLLKPKISPECIRYLDDVEISKNDKNLMFVLKEENDKRFNKKVQNFLAQDPTNKEFLSLKKNNEDAIKALPADEETNDVHAGYLTLFEKIKVKYRTEEDIINFIEKAKQDAKNNVKAVTLQTVPALLEEPKQPLASLPVSAEVIVADTKNQFENEKQSSQTSKEPQNFPSSPVEAPQSIPVPLLSEREEGKQELSQTLVEQHEQLLIFPVVTNNNNNQKEITLTAESESLSAVSKSDLEVEQEDNREKTSEEFSYAANDYLLFNKTKKEQQKPTAVKTKYNVLDLNKEQRDTLLQLFDLMPYDNIKLRALVNLTQALGGTLKTTGSNRCRMEIKNIYAHLLVPEQALSKVCNKATITMHGGGHSAKRSNNNDRENAPDYLIDQFKAAFVRAGYTPINLGLEVNGPAAPAHNLNNRYTIP